MKARMALATVAAVAGLALVAAAPASADPEQNNITFEIKRLMRRRIRIAAVLALFTALALPAGPVLAFPFGPVSHARLHCPTDKPLVVDAWRTIDNIADYGNLGNVWALDDVVERVRIWEVGPNYFCVRFDDAFAFTSFGGVSPGGTGTISAGVTGTGVDTYDIQIAGVFAPRVPTTGYLGAWDAGCDQTGSCTDRSWRVPTLYFSEVFSIHRGFQEASYDGGSHGTFSQSVYGSVGDITG